MICTITLYSLRLCRWNGNFYKFAHEARTEFKDLNWGHSVGTL